MKKVVMCAIIAMYLALIAGIIYYEWIEFVPRTADYFKFSTIVLSFLTALFLWKDSFSRHDGTILATAMFLTIIIDIFLVLYARVYSSQVIGMALYGIAQSIYFMRYHRNNSKNARILPFFLIIPTLLYILSLNEWFFLHGNRQRMLIIVVVYYIQVLVALLISMGVSIKRGDFPKINAVLIVAGMCIFCIGDIMVVLCNLEFFVRHRSFDAQLFRRLIWIFYAPSQALLAFSSNDYAKDKLRALQRKGVIL